MSTIPQNPDLLKHLFHLIEAQSAIADQQRVRDRLDNEARQVLQLLAHREHAGAIGERLGIDKRRVYWIRGKLVQSLRDTTETLGAHIGMTPWVEWQTGFDALNSHGARNY